MTIKKLKQAMKNHPRFVKGQTFYGLNFNETVISGRTIDPEPKWRIYAFKLRDAIGDRTVDGEGPTLQIAFNNWLEAANGKS